VHAYLTIFKIAPVLHAAARAARARVQPARVAGTAERRGAPGGRRRSSQRRRDRALDSKLVGAAAGLVPDQLRASRGKVRLYARPGRLPALAAIDQVRSIEPVVAKHFWNQVACGIIGAAQIQRNGELQGEGEIVAVATPASTGARRRRASRVQGPGAEALPARKPGDASDSDGHGTHVCGSLLGDGYSPPYGPIRGAAPKAKLIVQAIMGPSGGIDGIPLDLAELFTVPYEDGARVHSNSWNGEKDGKQDAHELDASSGLIANAVIVIGAGNQGCDAT